MSDSFVIIMNQEKMNFVRDLSESQQQAAADSREIWRLNTICFCSSTRHSQHFQTSVAPLFGVLLVNRAATMHTKEETIAVLKQFDIGSKFSFLPVLPKASVLIPLFVKNEQLHTLMTLRSKELRTSAGEVCFPGGKRDPSDRDDVDTALREAEEEIGLPPDKVQVVCRLFPIINKSGLLVTPVVGFIDESFCPCPNPAEVSAVFSVPLDFFTSQKDHHGAHGVAGMMVPLHSFHFVDPTSGSQYHIWGLTAMLAILVAALALKKKPEFDVGFDSEDPSTFFQQILHRRISKL